MYFVGFSIRGQRRQSSQKRQPTRADHTTLAPPTPHVHALYSTFHSTGCVPCPHHASDAILKVYTVSMPQLFTPCSPRLQSRHQIRSSSPLDSRALCPADNKSSASLEPSVQQRANQARRFRRDVATQQPRAAALPSKHPSTQTRPHPVPLPPPPPEHLPAASASGHPQTPRPQSRRYRNREALLEACQASRRSHGASRMRTAPACFFLRL
jgi:hypothetical protein